MDEYYSKFFIERAAQVYCNYAKGSLSSSEALSIMSESFLFKEMSIIRDIQAELKIHSAKDCNTTWLRTFVKNIAAPYFTYLFSFDMKVSDISYETYMRNTINKNSKKLYADFNSMIVSNNLEHQFWELISVVSDYISNNY